MQGSYLCNGNYIKGETAGYAVKNSVLNLISDREISPFRDAKPL